MADKKDTGTSLALGWGLLLLFLSTMIWLIWIYNKYQIMDAVRWLRWAELQPIRLFVATNTEMFVDGNGIPVTFGRFMELVRLTPSLELSPVAVGMISSITMSYYKYLFTLIFGAMAIWVMFRGPSTYFRKKYDLGGLLKEQSKTFPYIAPLIEFNPSEQPFRAPGSKVPADLPPFSEALSPEEWIAFHTVPTLTDRKIDEVATAAAFARQLGKPWKGWKALPPYKQVLLASFALKSARKRKESDVMVGQLAQCWIKGKLSLSGALVREARSVLRNEKISGKIMTKCNQHAFETTALIRGLATAREEGGVLAPATFIWLRAYDRALWYPLNNLGRNAYHMEAMGAMAHYKAEKMAQRPIVRPRVDGAVQALADYMKSLRARPIPELDYTNSKRRAIKKVGASS
jgi:intracellular multiplication protein IcmP